MADGLAERIKKFLRPVYAFAPGYGMGFGRGVSFMSQEDFATKYPRVMPGINWSDSKPHLDEMDTPANRAKLEKEIVDQEISFAFRMGKLISSKELTALYRAGRGAKHQIGNGNAFAVEYDQFGTPTHVTLDFGLGDVWRSRVGFMSEAISAHERVRDVNHHNSQQHRRDQVQSAVFSPVLAKLREAQSAENAEIYDFLSKVDVAPKAQVSAHTEAQTQNVRQVNVLQSHYISRDGNLTFERLKDHPKALRGDPDDTGVSLGLTQLAAIRDVLRAAPEATISNQSAVLGQPGSSYYLNADGSQLLHTSMVKERDEELDEIIDQPHDRVYDVDSLKEIETDNLGVEWKEIDALEKGFEPDQDQAALRLKVVERLREGDIESLNFEEEGVSFHLDGDMLVESWADPDQSFAWDADKCDVPLYATDIHQAEVIDQQIVQDAAYELTEQDRQHIAEIEAETMAEEKQVEDPPVEFTPEELHELAEEQKAAIPLLEAELRETEARAVYEQDRERWVQEQVQENIAAGIVDDGDLYADYDRETIELELAAASEAAYEQQHAAQSDTLSDGRDREVFEIYREADYQHSEWMAGDRKEAVDLSVAPEGVTEREWARAASDYKEWELEHEENRQEPTIDEVIQLDNASAEHDERREHELELCNQLAHLRMPDGGTFVKHVLERHEQGHHSTNIGDVEYLIDGSDLVSRHGSEELRGEASMVDLMVTERHKQADQFTASLQPAQVESVSAVETQNQPELLNTQKANDNQQEADVSEGQHRRGSMAEVADNAVARDGSEFSLTDVRDYARNKREESGQPLSPQSRAIQEQLQEHEAQSQKLTNNQRQ